MVLCCEMLRKPSRGYGGGLVKLVRLAWVVVVLCRKRWVGGGVETIHCKHQHLNIDVTARVGRNQRAVCDRPRR